ncbi:MAG TPA: zinc ribbon domain-containing protein [Gemmatimonadaceae bacterium]|nr:zinc ribbon domain-containing protein [Gemmatimonadaceae bacterium]
MPTYEFRCPLGHEFERFYRTIGTAEAQTACPECGQVAERQMSAGAGLVFKGSGFYLTDYGKDAHKKKDPAASKGDGAKPESGSSGSDGAAPAAASGGESATSESKSTKSESKSAEAKPAPKPSGGE